MPSFGEGFFKGTEEVLDKQQNDKFQMALLSKRMEVESNLRMAEAQKQHDLKMESGKTLGALGKALRPGMDVSGLMGQSFPEGTSNAFIGAVGQQLKAEQLANKPIVRVDKGSDGIDYAVKIDPLTMQEGPKVSLGLNQHNSDMVRKSDAAIESVRSIIQSMNTRVQAALTKSPMNVPGQRANIRFNDLLPYDPDLKRFVDGQADRALQIIKMTQGTVGRSWEQVQAELKGFGNGTDTVQLALDKNNDKLADVISQGRATIASFDPTNYAKSKNHPLRAGAQQAVEAQQAGDPEKFLREAVQRRLQRESLVQSQAKPNGSKQ